MSTATEPKAAGKTPTPKWRIEVGSRYLNLAGRILRRAALENAERRETNEAPTVAPAEAQG